MLRVCSDSYLSLSVCSGTLEFFLSLLFFYVTLLQTLHTFLLLFFYVTATESDVAESHKIIIITIIICSNVPEQTPFTLNYAYSKIIQLSH